MLIFFSIFIIQGIRIQNGWKMKHFFWCVTLVVMTYQANKLDKFRFITEKTYCYFNVTFHSRKRNFCHTKLQTIIFEVRFSKFLYLIANWTPYPKPIKEALTILRFPLKLLITSSFNGQQLVFLEKLNNFLKVPYAP